MANPAPSPACSIDDSAPPADGRRTRLDLELTPSRPDRMPARALDIDLVDLGDSLRFSKAVTRRGLEHGPSGPVLDDLRKAMADLSGALHARHEHRHCGNRAPSGLAAWVRRAVSQAIQGLIKGRSRTDQKLIKE